MCPRLPPPARCRWAKRRGRSAELRSSARPGEFFVWQVGVWAPAAALRVTNSSLASARWMRGGDSSELTEQLLGNFHAFNVRGRDEHGGPLHLEPEI